MRLNSNWLIKEKCTDFFSDSITANGVATMVDMSGNSLSVDGLYRFNLQENYSPFVKLGWHSWDLKITNIITEINVNDNGDDEFYSVDIDGKINETMKYRVEFERMKINSDDVDDIGLLFDFY